jgi:hypothetical protein
MRVQEKLAVSNPRHLFLILNQPFPSYQYTCTISSYRQHGSKPLQASVLRASLE